MNTQAAMAERDKLKSFIDSLEVTYDNLRIIRTYEDWVKFDRWARLGLHHNAQSRWGPKEEELPVAVKYDYDYGDCGPDFVEYHYYTIDSANKALAEIKAMCEALSR